MGVNKKLAKKVVKTTPITTYSNITAIISDIHIPHHCKPTWRAFKKWVIEFRPKHIVILGDFLDLSSISRFDKHADSPVYVLPEIQEFVAEANFLLKYTQSITILAGNHEARFGKVITAAFGWAGKGLKGLSLQEQLYAQGLDPSIKYIEESTKSRGLRVAQFLLRHGDKQAGRTPAKNLASLKLDKTLGESEINGHHHVLQYAVRTNGEKTAIVIVNPCMTEDHEYAIGANWQRGFTILEHVTQEWATPYPVLVNKGKFSYAGKLFDGTKL